MHFTNTHAGVRQQVVAGDTPEKDCPWHRPVDRGTHAFSETAMSVLS
jgi:hypothetical protein